jgi:NAD-dependent dihydropyrimidine dehydrogenase PreA subunit/flavodoxin
MSLIRLLLGRRQFLSAFLNSALIMTFGRVARAFDMISQTGAAKASEKPAIGEKKALKGIVVYYSATGNTAQVANAIYNGMKSVIACDVAPIKMMKPADMAKYDVMAIGSPNWYFRVPSNVNIFTHDMPLMDGKHCIIFGTHGGMPVGQFWSMSRNILKKGMTIIGWSDWYGSDFLTPHSCVPDGEWGHPDSIDLAEAEAFGKRMAENSVRIYAGETDLIPDRIPGPDKGENTLWNPTKNESYKIQFAGAVGNASPRFDLTKCVYPRCTRCIENCVVNAIDFSVLTTAGSVLDRASTAAPLVLKEACQHCGGICERVCLYDAIAYTMDNQERVFHKIDMTKCTYPKCTICADECPQNAIDLTKKPPVIHNCCENESLCWGVCPENAIEATGTSTGRGGGGASGQGPMAEGPGGRGEMGQGQAPMPGGPVGPGGTAQNPGPVGTYTARFRPLIQEECTIGRVSELTAYPRIPIIKTLWPYHLDKG